MNLEELAKRMEMDYAQGDGPSEKELLAAAAACRELAQLRGVEHGPPNGNYTWIDGEYNADLRAATDAALDAAGGKMLTDTKVLTDGFEQSPEFRVYPPSATDLPQSGDDAEPKTQDLQ